jgi:hypothetical protein
MTVNERILEAQIEHLVYLDRYKGGVLEKIIGLLIPADDDLVELFAARLTTIESGGFDLPAA